jgi:hypothetical protein
MTFLTLFAMDELVVWNRVAVEVVAIAAGADSSCGCRSWAGHLS